MENTELGATTVTDYGKSLIQFINITKLDNKEKHIVNTSIWRNKNTHIFAAIFASIIVFVTVTETVSTENSQSKPIVRITCSDILANNYQQLTKQHLNVLFI